MNKNGVIAIMGGFLLLGIVCIVLLFPYVKKYKNERDSYLKYRVQYDNLIQGVKDRTQEQDSMKLRLSESIKKTEEKIDNDVLDIKNDFKKGKDEIYFGGNDNDGHIRAIDSLLTVNASRYPLVID